MVNVKKYKYPFRYSNIVDIPEVTTTTYGKKSFRYAAAAMWNSLPDNFRTESSFSQFKSLIQSWSTWDRVSLFYFQIKPNNASFLILMYVFMLLSPYSYYVFNFMLLYACSLSVLYSSYLC